MIKSIHCIAHRARPPCSMFHSNHQQLFSSFKIQHFQKQTFHRNLISLNENQQLDKKNANSESSPSEKSLFDKLQESLPNVPNLSNLSNIDTTQISDKLSKELNEQADKIEKDINKYVNDKIESNFPSNIPQQDETDDSSSSPPKTIPLSFKLGIAAFVIASCALWYFSPTAFHIVFSIIKGAVYSAGYMLGMILKFIPSK